MGRYLYDYGAFGLPQILFDLLKCRISLGYVYSFAVTQKLFIVVQSRTSRRRQLHPRHRREKKRNESLHQSKQTDLTQPQFISFLFFLLWRDNLCWHTRADTNRLLSS